MQINEPTAEISAAYARWKRNRAFLSGEDAVKAAKTAYLPALPDQSVDEYAKYLERIPFFAGAKRVKAGLKGLIFRKPVMLAIPTALTSIFATITPTGHTIGDLAEDLVDESLTTGFTGLLIDHPSATEGLTLANAVSSGFRPFIAVYQAESILEVTPAVVGNVQKIVRVRLLDDEDTVRELLLDDGAYAVIIHRKVGSSWLADAPIYPTKKGVKLDSIPFVLVCERPRTFNPVDGPLDDVVQLNKHIFKEGADAKDSRFYTSRPILCIKGAAKIDNLVISPATVLQFPDDNPDKPVTIEFVEFSGAGQDALEKAYKELKEEMAMIGLRMLASDKSAVEASETHAIRRASENSILAALARRVSERLEEAAKWVAWWMDNSEELSIKLSTDFLPTPMDAAEMKEWRKSFSNGVFSFETLCERLIDGEKLPEDFDIEAEVERRAADSLTADRPTDTPTAD